MSKTVPELSQTADHLISSAAEIGIHGNSVPSWFDWESALSMYYYSITGRSLTRPVYSLLVRASSTIRSLWRRSHARRLHSPSAAHHQALLQQPGHHPAAAAGRAGDRVVPCRGQKAATRLGCRRVCHAKVGQPSGTDRSPRCTGQSGSDRRVGEGARSQVLTPRFGVRWLDTALDCWVRGCWQRNSQRWVLAFATAGGKSKAVSHHRTPKRCKARPLH